MVEKELPDAQQLVEELHNGDWDRYLDSLIRVALTRRKHNVIRERIQIRREAADERGDG